MYAPVERILKRKDATVKVTARSVDGVFLRRVWVDGPLRAIKSQTVGRLRISDLS